MPSLLSHPASPSLNLLPTTFFFVSPVSRFSSFSRPNISNPLPLPYRSSFISPLTDITTAAIDRSACRRHIAIYWFYLFIYFLPNHTPFTRPRFLEPKAGQFNLWPNSSDRFDKQIPAFCRGCPSHTTKGFGFICKSI